jgi:Sec-independent protein translocase protein TatA
VRECDQAFKQVTAQVEVSIKDIVGRLSQIDIPADVIAVKLQLSTEGLAREIEALRTTVNTNSEDLGESLRASVGAMRRIKGEIDALITSLTSSYGRISEIATSSADTALGTRRFAEMIEEAAASTREFRQQATDLNHILSQLVQTIALGTERFAQMTGDAAASTQEFRQQATDLSRTFSQLAQTTASGTERFAQMTGDAAASMQQLRQQASELSQILTQPAQASASGIERFAQMTGDAAASMEKFREQAASLIQTLSQFAHQLEARGNLVQADLDQVRNEILSTVGNIKLDSEAFSNAVLQSAHALRDVIKEIGPQ